MQLGIDYRMPLLMLAFAGGYVLAAAACYVAVRVCMRILASGSLRLIAMLAVIGGLTCIALYLFDNGGVATAVVLGSGMGAKLAGSPGPPDRSRS